MKHYVYLMTGSEKKLIFMEEHDTDMYTDYSINYQLEPPLEKTTQYFDGLVVEEKFIENGIERERMLYEYDYKKRKISEKRYLHDYLAEELHTEYIENTIITSKIENGIVIERSIEKEYDNGTKTKEFYDFGELFEIQEESYVFDTNTYVTKVMNVDRELLSIISEQVDDFGRILHNKEVNADGSPISETIHVYGTDLVQEISFIDHVEGKTEIHQYTYDEYGNETEIVVKDDKGAQIAINKSIYNELGILIEERGVCTESLILATRFLGQKIKEYHLIHKYEDYQE